MNHLYMMLLKIPILDTNGNAVVKYVYDAWVTV